MTTTDYNRGRVDGSRDVALFLFILAAIWGIAWLFTGDGSVGISALSVTLAGLWALVPRPTHRRTTA